MRAGHSGDLDLVDIAQLDAVMAARRLADDAAASTPSPSAIVEPANATATPSPLAPIDTDSSTDSTTLILAIVLGVLGLVLVLGMSLLWCKRRRRTHRQEAHATYFKATTTTNSNEDGYGRRAAPYTMDTYPIQLSEYQPASSLPTEVAPAADMYYANNDSHAVLPLNYSRKIAMRGRPASLAGSGVSEDSSIVSNSERESETEWTTKLIQLHHQSTSSASSSSTSSSPREIIILHDPTKIRESDVRYGDSIFSQPSLGHTFARGSNAFRVSSFSYDLSPSLLDTNSSTVIMETTSQTSRESYDI